MCAICVCLMVWPFVKCYLNCSWNLIIYILSSPTLDLVVVVGGLVFAFGICSVVEFGHCSRYTVLFYSIYLSITKDCLELVSCIGAPFPTMFTLEKVIFSLFLNDSSTFRIDEELYLHIWWGKKIRPPVTVLVWTLKLKQVPVTWSYVFMILEHLLTCSVLIQLNYVGSQYCLNIYMNYSIDKYILHFMFNYMSTMCLLLRLVAHLG